MINRHSNSIQDSNVSRSFEEVLLVVSCGNASSVQDKGSQATNASSVQDKGSQATNASSVQDNGSQATTARSAKIRVNK